MLFTVIWSNRLKYLIGKRRVWTGETVKVTVWGEEEMACRILTSALAQWLADRMTQETKKRSVSNYFYLF